MLEIIYIIVGLILLFIGGESCLQGIIKLCSYSGLSKLFVSIIIIGCGTSMPELVVSIEAILKNSPNLIIGNIIGSNIANVMLILSFSSLIQPIILNNNALKREFVWLFTGIFLTLINIYYWQQLNIFFGIISCIIFTLYLTQSFILATKQKKQTNNEIEKLKIFSKNKIVFALAESIFGLLFMIIGGNLFVNGSIYLAKSFGISETIIGLTVVALGTSLPELAAAIAAGIKKENDIILGNIIGSSIFNTLGILGISTVIKTIHISWLSIYTDIFIMLIIYLLLAVLLIYKLSFNRIISIFMLIFYCYYFISPYL